MSINYRTYVGPHVRCAVPASTVDARSVQEAIGDVLHDASGDAYHEWSSSRGTRLYMPNVTVDWRDCDLETRTDFAFFPITPDQVCSEVTQFTMHFTQELATLRRFYGDEAVAVEWGIIQDYM